MKQLKYIGAVLLALTMFTACEKEFDAIPEEIATVPEGSAEAWAEWRRTGYPNLLPAIDYNHEIMNIQRGADGADIHGYRRYPLPQVEHDVNGANVEKAIGEDLEGNDSPNTDVWWARKQ